MASDPELLWLLLQAPDFFKIKVYKAIYFRFLKSSVGKKKYESEFFLFWGIVFLKILKVFFVRFRSFEKVFLRWNSVIAFVFYYVLFKCVWGVFRIFVFGDLRLEFEGDFLWSFWMISCLFWQFLLDVIGAVLGF